MAGGEGVIFILLVLQSTPEGTSQRDSVITIPGIEEGVISKKCPSTKTPNTGSAPAKSWAPLLRVEEVRGYYDT